MQDTPESAITRAVSLSGLRVVDVGCGEGDLSRFLASQGAVSVTGVECGEEMLAHARAGHSRPNLRFAEGTGEALPLQDGSADVIVYSNSLHHVPMSAQLAALREARRVLAEGGHLLVLEPIARGPVQELLAPVHDETEVRAHARKQLEAVLASGEFRRVSGRELVKTVIHASFEAFRDRIIRINPDKRIAVMGLGASWRERFEQIGTRVDGGWRFEQPIAFDHLRRA